MLYWLNAAPYLHQHAEESLLVLSPQCGQLLSRREQTAASVHCDFWTVAKVHTEVLQRTQRHKLMHETALGPKPLPHCALFLIWLDRCLRTNIQGLGVIYGLRWHLLVASWRPTELLSHTLEWTDLLSCSPCDSVSLLPSLLRQGCCPLSDRKS